MVAVKMDCITVTPNVSKTPRKGPHLEEAGAISRDSLEALTDTESTANAFNTRHGVSCSRLLGSVGHDKSRQNDQR
jgi:hypothetical protein